MQRFKLKISEYIQYLQELKNKRGDVDVKVNKTYEWNGLSINDTYKSAEKPFYNKKQNCIVIESEFIGYN